ncbi:MAG: tetratricopeptide repeat protein, partial [Bacteroidetes bacterium]|nr:tetratricopeptide repeat protein [Bacteroidota bacterium]
MMFRHYRILFFLVAITIVVKQSHARNEDIDLSNADSLQTLLKKDKADTGKVSHLNLLSGEYNKIRSYDSAFYFGNMALKLAEQLNFQKGIADAYSKIGNSYESKECLSKALENYQASLKIYTDISDKYGIAYSYYNIGSVYWKQGNYSLALQNLATSLKLRQEIGDKKGIASANNI